MYCVTPIISGNNLYGALVLSVPIEQVVAQIELIKWQILLVSVATGVGAIILITLFSGTMLKPIRQLTQGIAKIASGDFTQRVKVQGNSEMAQLAKTFNEMSERLENLDHTRNEFVANASHELKTPMSTIKILVETLQHQKKFDPEITKELLGDVSSEIDRMSLLVGDLLSLVRMDEEKTTALPFKEICLSGMLMEVCDILIPIAYKRRIELDLSITADIYYTGDEAKIKRVFINLIDNAIKYSEDNSTVEVSLKASEKEILFIVRDHGVGISQEDIPYIFDRFYRVDKTRSRQTGGTGLGLSIVKSIVLLHGGQIDVQSEPGHGTSMRVSLPINQNKKKG
jgi:signal transduction histidine kinase